MKITSMRGYTLVELIVAVGLFALIMLLASGAYLFMLNINRQAQGIASGIDNLSFALETMTRDIRTGYGYPTPGSSCGLTSFSFSDQYGNTVAYSSSGGVLQKTTNGGLAVDLTDKSVNISNLYFCIKGSKPISVDSTDIIQANVIIFVTGSVSLGPNKAPQTFSVETAATMRGTDL